MRFKVLGPLEVVHDGADAVALGGFNQRAILGFLLLNENRVVAISQLLDALWGDESPPTARKIVHNAVAKIRGLLAAETGDPAATALVTRPPGYLLEVGPDEVDLLRFRTAVERGRADLAQGRWDRATNAFDEALALWRGPVLADLAESGVTWPALAATESLRLATVEDAAEARLASGRHHEVVTMLEPLVTTGPPRERMCAQLMLALYRCGRQADALCVYRRARAVLVEKFGLDPHLDLQDLERAILTHDPSLTQAPETAQRPSPPPESPIRTAVKPAEHVLAERKYVSAVLINSPLHVGAGDDPETFGAAQHEIAAAVRTEVERLGGTLHCRVGPVHVALFGVPRTAADDAQRAVRAALCVRERLARLCSVDGPYRGSARITVSTGEVLVRHTRSGVEVTGALVDHGLRMQEDIAPGGIRVCHTTQRTCENDFAFLAPDSPDAGYEVIDRHHRPSPSVTVPMVGRDREVRLLQDELARVERAGRARLVVVAGVPGIGKSRLVQEFGAALADRPVQFVVSRAGGPGALGSLDALSEIVRSYIGATDAEADAEAKLDTAVRDLVGQGSAADWLVTRLRPLLNPDPDTAHSLAVDESLIGFRRFMEEIAARLPLVVVFEDVHSLDDPLVTFISELTTRVMSVPMLVVATTRPDPSRSVDWSGRTITLDVLTSYDTGKLVEALSTRMGLCAADGDSMTGPALERFRTALLERIGGVPLFAAEYVRMLRDGHPGQDDRDPTGWMDIDGVIALPRTVHNVVASRIDDLTPLEKAVLRDAALLAEAISADAVAAVGPRDRDEVTTALGGLVRNGLLDRVDDRSEYVFRHVLVRVIACAQLPRRGRADRHRRAAQWLEQQPGHDKLAADHRGLAAPPPLVTSAERPVVATEAFQQGSRLSLPLQRTSS